jgi:UDP-N-acetylglucosamine transferase subunit ALG13
MDRLLKALDELVTGGTIAEEVLVQAAAFHYQPEHLDTMPVVAYSTLIELIRRADVVVSHAGPGLLATVRLEGKSPVVVPRSSRHGEHVDDHQELYAERLREIPGYVVVRDLDDLPTALLAARAATINYEPPDVSRAVAALNELIGH